MGKKLVLTIRAVMLKENVDLVAGDINGVAWRRENSNNISLIEEAFADCALPMPPGPPSHFGDPDRFLCLGFLKPPESDGQWKVRVRGAFPFPRDVLRLRPNDQNCHHKLSIKVETICAQDNLCFRVTRSNTPNWDFKNSDALPKRQETESKIAKMRLRPNSVRESQLAERGFTKDKAARAKKEDSSKDNFLSERPRRKFMKEAIASCMKVSKGLTIQCQRCCSYMKVGFQGCLCGGTLNIKKIQAFHCRRLHDLPRMGKCTGSHTIENNTSRCANTQIL